MADVLLGFVIQNLGSFAREELATFLGVEQLTQRLSGNLTIIRAVLKDAEKKQITSDEVKDWLKKLTHAAHVLDDILDECSITSKAYGNNKWITRFHPKKTLARRNIGKRMKVIAEKIDYIAEERNKFGLHVGVMEEHKHGDDEWRQTTSFIAEPKVYGRDHDREQVVEFLLTHAVDSVELSIYSIVGVGGFGKTTLAQMVFNDERVSTHFNLKIWVCVSDDFSVMKILVAIIESAIGKYPDPSSLESMQKKVREILQNKRYLLVLDDVWNEDQEKWNNFKYFLRGNGIKGASVLVTTRLGNVGSIMGTFPSHHLEGLSNDDIWSLFKHRAFETNTEERAELVAIGKEIVRKCVGSPLAAKVLGSLLRFKKEEHQWLSIKESNLWDLFEDKDNPIMTVLRLSYFNLKSSLKPCFTFCAVFPKDFEMEKEQLIHLWLANGFISLRGNSDAEHVGDEVWNELYDRSFFQEVNTDEKGYVTFKMHDLIHDLAQSIMEEECMASEAASLTNLSERVHHISCFFKDKRSSYNTIPFKKVESLRTFLEFDAPFEMSDSFPSITHLRALRTGSSQLSALKSLTHLRYLELFQSLISTLPASVCKLQSLQILKLDSCWCLSSLPKNLTQLQDLRHLVIKNCPSLVSTPSKIGKLTCLKTLSTFIVGFKVGFGLAELRDLQLGGKLHIRGLENVKSEWDAKEANLISKKDLNSLFLSWDSQANSQSIDTNAAQVLEALEPHAGLKGFGMKDYAGIHFPRWMITSFLEGLVDVTLYNCKNCQRLPSFGKLPHLNTLYVSGMRDLKYIDDDVLYESTTERAFVSLKKLTLRGLPNLERMLEVEGVEMLPQLSYLRISGVPKLALPSLPSLEVLFVSGINEVDLFPKEIVCNMLNLKILDIARFDTLKFLPDDLRSLSALEELYISHCYELESLSMHALQGLNSLRTLTIRFCTKLISLSEGMGDLVCLQRLEIFHCRQLVLPSNMNRLTALREVEIMDHDENNKILEGLKVIPSLQILTLKLFSYLPEWLGDMTSLQVVELICCENVRSLPNSFQQLTNLKVLRILGCPRLEKRCNKETGEDWPKIAHVHELVFNNEQTFWENAENKFSKFREGFRHELRFYTTSEMEFNEIVDSF